VINWIGEEGGKEGGRKGGKEHLPTVIHHLLKIFSGLADLIPTHEFLFLIFSFLSPPRLAIEFFAPLARPPRPSTLV